MNLLTLLNTRPAHQARALSQQVKSLGHTVVECPAIQIDSLTLDEKAKASWAEFDKVIFISRNAVQQFASQWQEQFGEAVPENRSKMYAIGDATQKAMQAQYWTVQDAERKQFDSEHLLAQLALQSLQGQRCLIIKGDGGREALEKGLIAKGAQVTSWSVYRRKVPSFCHQAWSKWQAAEHPVMLVSSFEAWQNLFEGVKSLEIEAKNYQAWWFLQDVIVFSDRIKTKLMQAGWQGRIFVVPQQNDLGVVKILQAMSQQSI